MSVTSTANPVFSDFSHLPKLNDLTFAVGLRSDDDADEVLHRMLPLAFVTPGKPVERVIRQKAEEGICQRPECIARRDKLEELNSENDELKSDLKSLQDKVEASKNRIKLLDKSIALQEEKNDSLRAEIDESSSRLLQVDVDVEKGEKQNQLLRKRLEALIVELDKFKSKADEQKQMIHTLQPGASEIVFSRVQARDPVSKEVTALPGYDDDSDDD